jgi:hypothetical protein
MRRRLVASSDDKRFEEDAVLAFDLLARVVFDTPSLRESPSLSINKEDVPMEVAVCTAAVTEELLLVAT